MKLLFYLTTRSCDFSITFLLYFYEYLRRYFGIGVLYGFLSMCNYFFVYCFVPMVTTSSRVIVVSSLYIFVVNFDALAQASDIRIERRQAVFLC